MRRAAFAIAFFALATRCSLMTNLDELRGGADAAADVTPADAASDGDGTSVCGSDTDPANCGYCGHDCRGAKCTSGVCDPQILASNLNGASGVAVDATNVYFTTYFTGTVETCPVTGGTPKTLSSGDVGSSDIKVNATQIFWANEGSGQGSGSIKSCALPGCTQKTTIGSGTLVEWVQIDSSRVYWTSTYDGTASSCPLAGCGGSPTPIATGVTVPWGITVDSSNVYLAIWNGTLNAPATNGGEIATCPLPGCTGKPTALSSVENQPWQIVVDGAELFWTSFKDNSVKKCTLPSCANPTILASGEGGPSGIAVDSRYVYWTNYTSGSVRVCDKNGCDKVSATMAVGQNHPNNITLDATSLYFTTLGSGTGTANDGTVVKVPK